MERTFCMIKPDAIQRNLAGEIISRFEKKGLKLMAMKFILMPKEKAEDLYAVHKGKPFYDGLIKLATSSPVIATVWEGTEAVKVVRTLIGSTKSREAAPGTVRGDYGMGVPENLVHASDSMENAQKEMSIFFSEDEMYAHEKHVDVWLGKE
jgi:nucleoside-diphosphate kinase